MDMKFRIPYEWYYEELGRKTDALFHAMRESIVNGTLAQGTRLPSSRRLAELYGVSRGSVNAAYDMLIAEGFARAAGGSGTFVAYSDPLSGMVHGAAVRAPLALSEWGERLVSAKALFRVGEAHPLLQVPGVSEEMCFRLREPDVSLFPVEAWRRTLFAEVRDMMAVFPAITAPVEGYLPLREAIAQDLRRERGMRANAANICITNGSMHAIALLMKLLVNPGRPVVVENPSYAGIRRAIYAEGGSILAAALDHQGIVPEEWRSELLFVTPTRQFPTGAVLSASRRTELLAWASRQGAVIIEDDYDSELQWGGRLVEPLKALDSEERVVYIGTFSKTMFMDLRLGYVVLPEALLEPFRLAKALQEPHPSALVEQRAMAHFIGSGDYARHLRRMKRVIGRRLLVFRDEVERRLSRWFRFVPADAGLHMYAVWRGDAVSYAKLRERCAALGVTWTVGDAYWEGDIPHSTALFGFAQLQEAQIKEGALRIESVCEALQTY
ncbi:PLP-dependent aminotransferase family protein [Paenibacillus sp. R14(2021)]|uniref:MocR-like pyridoxine biosynthesis transcription factor PdxR n=1 Tax=Paenibacillus sp. R14(2021) TaxID=2859228 RepID=UPI002157EB12|nr:PLP-dependent aminotransferase family protein [Paenibacillus sp. R14(2021)]